MWSRFATLYARRSPTKVPYRTKWLPSTPYDSKTQGKLSPHHLWHHSWECLPVVVVTGLAVAGVFANVIYAFRNKVDVLLWSHDPQRAISRTMDLRNPTVHKLVIINQRYEPWPEMQDVLDRMRAAEVEDCQH